MQHNRYDVVPAGLQGSKGDRGPTGPRGEQGEKGIKGQAGIPGKTSLEAFKARLDAMLGSLILRFQPHGRGWN